MARIAPMLPNERAVRRRCNIRRTWRRLDAMRFRSTMIVGMSLSGILNVDKPRGMTSRDVVDRIKWVTRPEKVGHAGTLDPLATGVLVICVGQATRLIQYVQRLPKKYAATFLLGSQSETDDLEG